MVQRHYHTIVQTKPAVVSTTKLDSVSLERTQSRRSRTRVYDLSASAFDCFHVLVCQSGNTGEMLKKIQGHTLRRDQHVSEPDHSCDHLPCLDCLTIGNKRFELLLRIE